MNTTLDQQIALAIQSWEDHGAQRNGCRVRRVALSTGDDGAVREVREYRWDTSLFLGCGLMAGLYCNGVFVRWLTDAERMQPLAVVEGEARRTDPLVREIAVLQAKAESACPETRLLLEMARQAQDGKLGLADIVQRIMDTAANGGLGI